MRKNVKNARPNEAAWPLESTRVAVPLTERRERPLAPTEALMGSSRVEQRGDGPSQPSGIADTAHLLDAVRDDRDLRDEVTYSSPLDSKAFWLRDHNYSSTRAAPDAGAHEGEHFILENDQAALVHTGISMEKLLMLVVKVQHYAKRGFPLSVRSQVVMTLMTLKTNRPLADLSRYFHTSESTALKIVLYWIDMLAKVLRHSIPWLPKEIIQATMPNEFRERFPNMTCFVGYSESILQKREGRCPSTTVKYLLAVAPCGLIMFMSSAYTGRRDHRDMVRDSGLLHLLMPGDEVMTQGGFAIKELLFERQVKLVVTSLGKNDGRPASTSPSSSSSSSSSSTDYIAHAGDRIQGAIQHLMTYKILSQGVPTTLAPHIDKILWICAALTNLRIQVLK
ncbi:uncharacterized protein LOC109520836 [Hippocampus comes]|uniref:Uncharacterized LOC109520836 n=1 Tax=Hippocampus comes TaxID=109280 RepID=A0A3Q3DY72_HIPCM|nr:PREDICTED: uncharacterized protein LOC109520836 [Hippocampus comes]